MDHGARQSHIQEVSISALSDRGLLRARNAVRCSERKVSISALSDRGLLPTLPAVCVMYVPRFNIRSFGSWIASTWKRNFGCGSRVVSISALSDRGLLPVTLFCAYGYTGGFNIRSFGSWIASGCGHDWSYAWRKFQYPLFRIVDCFTRFGTWSQTQSIVSISALSDRGLLHRTSLRSGHTL